MRILVLNQYFDPDVAASAQRLTELVEDLAAHHDVTVIAGRPSYDAVRGTRERARPRRLRIRRVPSSAFHRQRPAGRVLNYLTYLGSALTAALAQRRPDLLIAATDPPFIGSIARWVSLLKRVPFIYLLWDVQPHAARAAGAVGDGLAMKIAESLSRGALSHASAIVVPTRDMKDSAVRGGAPAERVHVIPLWEDTSRITPQARDNRFSREHRLLDTFVVMYSGNIGLTQRLDVLVEVAHRMRGDDVVFVVIGDGAGKRALEDEASRRGVRNVRFLPYRPADEVLFSFATADVFVVALREGMTRYMHPSKVFSIMASGRPVIAAIDETSAMAELITSERMGFVVSPGDASGVEQHVRWLQSHPEERVTMGQRARALAERKYSRSVVVPRYLELVRSFDPAPNHR